MMSLDEIKGGGDIEWSPVSNRGIKVLRSGGLKWCSVMLVAGLVVGANAADPPVDLPPVRAVPATDGGKIICYGYRCAGLLNSLLPAPPPIEMDVISIDQSGVDRSQFCGMLKSQKPSSCSASSPPATPDTDPSWRPNGCGNNWRVQAAMQLGIMAIVPDDFAGNYNAPYSGVSFEAACNNHDRCYGLAFDKAFCDERFGDEMRSACSLVSSSSGYNQCAGLADIYRGAVAVFGASAYQSAVRDHECAVWVKDMKQNGCSQ